MLERGDEALIEHLPIGLTVLLRNPPQGVRPGWGRRRFLCFLQRDVSGKGFILGRGLIPLASWSPAIENIDHAVPGVPKAVTDTVQVPSLVSSITGGGHIVTIVVLGIQGPGILLDRCLVQTAAAHVTRGSRATRCGQVWLQWGCPPIAGGFIVPGLRAAMPPVP